MRLGLVHPAIRQRPFSADIVMLGWTAAGLHYHGLMRSPKLCRLFPLRVIFDFGAVLNNDRLPTGDIARALLWTVF
jgi:hypothetical protein